MRLAGVIRWCKIRKRKENKLMINKKMRPFLIITLYPTYFYGSHPAVSTYTATKILRKKNIMIIRKKKKYI